MPRDITRSLSNLQKDLKGEVLMDDLSRVLYATDASIYQEMPTAVVTPKTEEDLVKIVDFCQNETIPLIPRAAGTSLAGQVVGQGIICDTSRYLNEIRSIDPIKKTITVEPGVIRDELNQRIKPHGLFLGPNTSTSNRCNIGGMIGNNSSGTTSIKFGTTRDKIISIRGITSDANIHDFSAVDTTTFHPPPGVYQDVYAHILSRFQDPKLRQRIISSYPNSDIHRRNTGYALDVLLSSKPFETNGPEFNLAKLLCGSEGTLALTSQATLQLDDLPPPLMSMVTLECDSIHNAMLAVQTIMSTSPYQCELMDDVILRCTIGHPKYGRTLSALNGISRAVLMVEYRATSQDELMSITNDATHLFKGTGLASHIGIHDHDTSMALWELRKAGLGLLANVQGKKKAVACIEDTAVSLKDLPKYIEEFEALMQAHHQNAVYYAHAGAGELHLRPLLDLTTDAGKKGLEDISRESALLVKKYNGSLSGEHGDGRVRAPYIKDVLGEEVYEELKQLKNIFDPNGIFNPGKIVNAKPIASDLRDQALPSMEGFIHFGNDESLLHMAARCNGSGDCRKPAVLGGTMCPSYHATREEKHTTRARANALRNLLSREETIHFNQPQLKEVLDLCISCKGCTRECPSNVDMALMKSEFLYQFHQHNRRPLRDHLFGIMPGLARHSRTLVRLGIGMMNTGPGKWWRKLLGISNTRQLPKLSKKVQKEIQKKYEWQPDALSDETVILFQDEFTNSFDAHLIALSLEVLSALNIPVMLSPVMNSARSQLSKGFLRQARQIVDKQIQTLMPCINRGNDIIGIEPSAILSLTDEWPKVCSQDHRISAKQLKHQVSTIETFLLKKLNEHASVKDLFNPANGRFHVHVHCHYKALDKEDNIYHLLSLIPESEVMKIPSGCCGMAGSFGYEAEHKEVSYTMADQAILPHLRTYSRGTVVANGVSCRHQIHDLAHRASKHPIEVIHQHFKFDQP